MIYLLIQTPVLRHCTKSRHERRPTWSSHWPRLASHKNVVTVGKSTDSANCWRRHDVARTASRFTRHTCSTFVRGRGSFSHDGLLGHWIYSETDGGIFLARYWSSTSSERGNARSRHAAPATLPTRPNPAPIIYLNPNWTTRPIRCPGRPLTSVCYAKPGH